MERFIDTIRNKYFIAGMTLVVWMCFFDRYDLATQYTYQKEKNKLEAEKTFYTSEIGAITQAIHDVKHDPNLIQKIARERYMMKKDTEDIFIVTDASSPE